MPDSGGHFIKSFNIDKSALNRLMEPPRLNSGDNTATLANEKRKAEGIFQLIDQPGDTRLGNVHVMGSRRDGAMPHHAVECLELPEVHGFQSPP